MLNASKNFVNFIFPLIAKDYCPNLINLSWIHLCKQFMDLHCTPSMISTSFLGKKTKSVQNTPTAIKSRPYTIAIRLPACYRGIISIVRQFVLRITCCTHMLVQTHSGPLEHQHYPNTGSKQKSLHNEIYK